MKPIKLALAVALFLSAASGAFAADAAKWVGAWGFPVTTIGPLPAPVAPTPPAVAPADAPAGAPAPAARPAPAPQPQFYNNVTLRHTLRVATGGDDIRVRLSNEFGAAAMKIGAARIGLVGPDGGIIPGSDRPLTFNGGLASVTIPSFAPMISDPASLKVSARQVVAISLYLPEETRIPSHRPGLLVAPGDQTAAATLTDITARRGGAIVSQVEVKSSTVKAVIVAFGDSITEGGVDSTPLRYNSWPDVLADRIAASLYAGKISVVNAGISGNRLLREGAGANALARFDRDISSVSGATHVIVLEAINDIGTGMRRPSEDPTVEELIGAYRQLIARAHAKGLKIYGATLTPYLGASYASPAGEVKRQALNAFIRTPGNFDGFIEFEKAVSDPAAPDRWLASMHINDHLHPNVAGYEAMAKAIDLKMFGVK